MRYFFDTEFIEDGHTIELISIGVVSEDGKEFYAESSEVPWHRSTPWVDENVRPHLLGPTPVSEWPTGGWGGFLRRRDIASDLLDFIGEDQGKPEFWAYYADYDWVVLCQLYGRMLDLPDGWPMFCMDIKQLAVEKGNPRLPEQTSTEHHALADARWNVEAWNFLSSPSAATTSEAHHHGEGCVYTYPDCDEE